MQLLSFEVYVDQTTTESDEQRQLAQKHPWARLNVKSEPRAFGQGHSLNLALAAAECRPCGTAAVIYTQVRPRPRDTLGGMVGSG